MFHICFLEILLVMGNTVAMKSSSAYAGRRLREETHDHKTAAQYREF